MSTSFVATAGLEAAPLADGGAVLYSDKTGKFIRLNRSADLLWTALSSAKTEDDLVRGLCRVYPGIGTPTAREAVSQTLENLLRLDLVRAHPGGGGVAPHAPADGGGTGGEKRAEYAPPTVEVLGEEDLLKAFQMTAAEISVAGCWWGSCSGSA